MSLFEKSVLKIHSVLLRFVKDKIKNEKVYSFVEKLSIVFILNGTAIFFQMLTSILTAGYLGPEEYGKISLINSISIFLINPLIIGAHNAMFKMLPNCEDEEKEKLISTTALCNIINLLPMVGIYLVIYPLFIKNMNISFDIWTVGILFTVISEMYVLSESFLRGKKAFMKIGKFQLLSKLLFFVLMLLVVYVFKIPSYSAYIACFFIARAVFVVLAIKNTKIDFRKFSWPLAKKIYQYGSITMLNALLLGVMMYTDIVIINYFESGMDLGIYSAYKNFALTMFLIVFDEIFAVVFLPTIAAMNIKDFFKGLLPKLPLIFIGLCVVISMAVTLLILLFGKKYKLDFGYVGLTSVGIALAGIFELLFNTISLEGKKGAKICTLNLAVVAPLSLVAQFFLIKNWGVVGSFWAMICAHGALSLSLIISFIIWIRRSEKRAETKLAELEYEVKKV